MTLRTAFSAAVLLLHVSAVGAADCITIMTDAFGRAPALHRDWGFVALIEVGGKRILFDTGNDRRKFGFGPIRLLVGGFHWVNTPEAELPRMASALRDDFYVASVAPGHCTGEPAFSELREVFGDDYVYAGVGTVIALDAASRGKAGGTPR